MPLEEEYIEKLETIWNAYVNGNHSDFSAYVKRLTKIGILDLIEYVSGYFGQPRHLVINAIRSGLKK